MGKKSDFQKPQEKEFETYDEFIEETESADEVDEPEDNEEPGSGVITHDQVQKVKIAIKKGVQGAKKLLKLYRIACRTGDEEVPRFQNVQVHSDILSLSLSELPKLFRKKLGKKLDKSSN